MCHVIHGCSAGLMVATLFGIACSAADIIASVMWFIFSSVSVDKFTFSSDSSFVYGFMRLIYGLDLSVSSSSWCLGRAGKGCGLRLWH